jgi:hypothetical protein
MAAEPWQLTCKEGALRQYRSFHIQPSNRNSVCILLRPLFSLFAARRNAEIEGSNLKSADLCDWLLAAARVSNCNM